MSVYTRQRDIPVSGVRQPVPLEAPPATATTEVREVRVRGPAYQAYQILLVGFALLPILAGADKFLNLLTNWSLYLAPQVPAMLGIPTETVITYCYDSQ